MIRPLRIGVIGSGSADATSLEAARAAGRGIARAEAVLLCGGLGGIMGAAAEGAAAEGGTVVGLLPGEDPRQASPHVSIPIATGLGQARNLLIVRASEAVVAIAGEWGTMSEASFCMKLGVPLVGLHAALPAAFPIDRFDEPNEAVARALELAEASRREGAG